MAPAVKDNMKDIFHKVQFNKTDHPRYMKKLTKLYERVSFSVPKHFNFAFFFRSQVL